MAVTIYHYPKCSTCKKALKWLESHRIETTRIDLVATPPSRAKLERLWRASGLPLKKLFNTSGESYRRGNFGARLSTMSDAEALDLLAADGKLIKRPIVESDEVVLVGFDEAKYESELSSRDR